MRKILILGAGNAQIDAILHCKGRGLEVYGCSYTNTDKGIPLLDHFKQVDIKDVEKIVEYVRAENIDYVYSVGSDLAVPTIMEVSEILNLNHFVSSKTARICQAKHKMRTALGADFKGNIAFHVCENISEALEYTSFPGMMKPVDSQGQRGCYRVDSLEDIKKYFEHSLSYSKSGKVIIEQYIDGPEVSVNAFIANGKVLFSLMSDRIVFDEYPGGIIKEHLLPTQYTDANANVQDLVGRIIHKLEINNGPLYLQLKLSHNEPYVLEITPRLDGCHMWNLIKHYCGVDLLDSTFSLLLNDPLPSFEPQKETYPTELKFMCERPGEKFDRSKYNCTGSEYCFWYYENGDLVKALNGHMEKCGYQIRRLAK